MKILKYIAAILTTIFCWTSFDAYAQKETELFIPIGQSPGVSGKLSVTGRVNTVALKMNDSTLNLGLSSGMIKLRLSSQTKIYLDKSKLKMTNTKGTLADIKTGSLVEVKYLENKPGNILEWIKVQIE